MFLRLLIYRLKKYNLPLALTLYETVLNNGDPNVIITTNLDANLIIKTK